MSEVIPITVSTLEELYQIMEEYGILDKNGILELVTRNENKRFKEFFKIALDKAKQPETQKKLEEAIEVLKEKSESLTKATDLISKSFNSFAGLNGLSKLTLVLDGMNLCATCIGFAIMYEKLDKLSDQIDAKIGEVIALNKDIAAIHADYEFKKVLSEHSNMLDCRKKQNYYSEDKMRELVASEYNVLDMLLEVFRKNVSNDQDLIFTILSLAAMLTVSLKYFDEVYYFNNKAVIGDGDCWHLDHDKWVGIFDKLAKADIVEKIQDYGFFDLGLSTAETDYFYRNYCGQIKGHQQEIRDNQTLIQAIDDAELFGLVQEKTKAAVQEQLRSTLQAVGLDSAICEEALRIAVA